MPRSITPEPAISAAATVRAKPAPQTPEFLSIGANRAVRLSAVETLVNVADMAELRLISGHALTTQIPWSQLYSVFCAPEHMHFSGKRRPMPEAGLTLDAEVTPAQSSATHITFTGMYGGGEITVPLTRVLAYQPRNGQAVLHMSSGKDLSFPIEHLPEIVAAFTAAYGKPAAITRPPSAPTGEYKWDPSHEFSSRYVLNRGQY